MDGLYMSEYVFIRCLLKKMLLNHHICKNVNIGEAPCVLHHNIDKSTNFEKYSLTFQIECI